MIDIVSNEDAKPARRKAEPSPEQMRRKQGADLYIVRSADGFLKIGRSSSAKSRLAELQVGNPAGLRLVKVLAGRGGEEKQIHRTLAEWRRWGEWFEDTHLCREKLCQTLEIRIKFRDADSPREEYRAATAGPSSLSIAVAKYCAEIRAGTDKRPKMARP